MHISYSYREKYNKRSFREMLSEMGIQTGIHYLPNHRLDYFSKYCVQNSYPNTDLIYEKILSIPLHPDLTNAQTNYVIDAILKIMSDN